MLVGLLSDTHIRDFQINADDLSTPALPPQIKTAFRNVDLILHAGDIYTLSVLDELETIAPVMAAEGDDDPFDVAQDKRVRRRHFIELDGISIWLAHDYEAWSWYRDEIWTWTHAGKLPDVIIFGHTHESLIEKRDGILKVNPGSPTFPRYRLELGTVAILSINSGKAEAEIVRL